MPSPPGADHYMSLWLLTFGAEENDVLRASLFLQALPFSVAQGSLQAPSPPQASPPFRMLLTGDLVHLCTGGGHQISPFQPSCPVHPLFCCHCTSGPRSCSWLSCPSAWPPLGALPPPQARSTVKSPTPGSPMSLLWHFSSRPPLQSCYGHSRPPHLPSPPSTASTSPVVLRPPRQTG